MINSPEMKSRIAPALSYLNVRMADMPNDPDWTRSELILVCEALRANGWQAIRATDPRAVHLSGLLRAMDIHPRGSRSDKFRSAASVQLKGYDLLNQLPGYDGKPTRGGRLDDAWTWRCRSHSPYPVLGQTSESGRRAFD